MDQKSFQLCYGSNMVKGTGSLREFFINKALMKDKQFEQELTTTDLHNTKSHNHQNNKVIKIQ